MVYQILILKVFYCFAPSVRYRIPFTTGKYVWSESGEEAVYTNWAEGQPDPAHAFPEVNLKD